MKIINLIEDTPGNGGYLYEHGLSFYVETQNRKLLVDTGATDAFIKNADKMGIDLKKVDTVIISHGHYDHAGGVLAFSQINPDAVIYIQKSAVGEFYNLKNGGTKYIGMDKRISLLPHVKFVEGDIKISESVSVFTGVKGTRYLPEGNKVLKRKLGENFCADTFDHEQYSVICEGDKRVMISGCAHKGVLNILDTYKDIYGDVPTHVISGFHTVRQEYTEEDEALIKNTAKELSKLNTFFYSGHCTGEYPMELMKKIMWDKLSVIHSGDVIL